MTWKASATLDCLAAYSAVNQGHCHPKILRTLTEQAQKVTLTSRAFRNEQLPLLYKELHDLTGFDMALPMNSGAEAVETAVKTARKWGYKIKGIPEGKAEIIVCANNFHGRTVDHRQLLDPTNNTAMALVRSLPGSRSFPLAMRKLCAQPSPPTPVSFLVEPIQGEAGIVIPAEGFLREAAEICRAKRRSAHRPTKFSRAWDETGKLFACMHESVTPDILICRQGAGRRFSILSPPSSPRKKFLASTSPAIMAAPLAAPAGLRSGSHRSASACRRKISGAFG